MVRLCVCFSFRSLTEAVPRRILKDFILSLTMVRGMTGQLLAKVTKEAGVDLDDKMLDVEGECREPGEGDTHGNAAVSSRP
jgi:hypothetical protein